MKDLLSPILGLVLAVSSIISVSQAADFQSARVAGLGGAGRAAPLLGDALYLNPAFTSFLKSYAMAVNNVSYGAEANQEPKGNIFNATILDGTNDLFQAGVGYTRRKEARFVHFGASRAVIQKLGVGLSAKMALPNTGGTAKDFALSFTSPILDWFYASLVIDNLLQTNEGKPYGFYRQISVGTKFNAAGIALIYFDPHLAPNNPNGSAYGHNAGLEVPMMYDLFLRGGVFYNSYQPEVNRFTRGFSLGAGWVAPKVSIDYAVSRPQEPRAVASHHISISFIL